MLHRDDDHLPPTDTTTDTTIRQQTAHTAMPRNNARFIAITTLHRLLKEKTVLPILFDRVCARNSITGADRALAMNLIYGVLRSYHALELAMSTLCRQPLKKLHPIAYQALAVGLYQIFFLERIPASAAVNETVEGAKRAGLPSRLNGFVNGVLRQSLRNREQLLRTMEKDEDGNRPLNHPAWLTRRWSERFGRQEMEAICEANNRRPPLSLRIDRSRLTPEEYIAVLTGNNITARPGLYAPDCVLLPDYSGTVDDLPGYREGVFHVQGEAAQLCCLLLGPFHDGCSCLDGCAGMGGKTAHLHQLLAPYHGSLTALEPEGSRFAKLQEALTAKPGVSLVNDDLETFSARSQQPFDGVLVDAPCSGTGVIGRQPDIRWRRTAAEINRYADRQQELVRTAASLVNRGGVLVYATCSLEEEENMAVIREFLASRPDFSLSDATPLLPAPAGSLVREGCFQPRPSENLDGFFAARLVRHFRDD